MQNDKLSYRVNASREQKWS